MIRLNDFNNVTEVCWMCWCGVQVMSAAVGQVNDVAQGNLTAADLNRAKWVTHTHQCICVHVSIKEVLFCLIRNQLKADYLMSIESSEGLLEAIGTQALTEGTYHSSEVMSLNIDAVSSADVVNVRAEQNTSTTHRHRSHLALLFLAMWLNPIILTNQKSPLYWANMFDLSALL